MALSSGTSQTSAAMLKKLGLVSSHSYGLVRTEEVTKEDGETVRLVLLRNPWGHFEWEGDWSDKSELWTDELKQQVGFTDDEFDGLFWMAIPDLMKYFNRAQICRVNDSYFYSYQTQ